MSIPNSTRRHSLHAQSDDETQSAKHVRRGGDMQVRVECKLWRWRRCVIVTRTCRWAPAVLTLIARQGIPWSRLPYTRAHYRQERLAAYRNYVRAAGGIQPPALLPAALPPSHPTLTTRLPVPRAPGELPGPAARCTTPGAWRSRGLLPWTLRGDPLLCLWLCQECAPLLEDAQLFTFRLNSRVPRSQSAPRRAAAPHSVCVSPLCSSPPVVHFQLRNLVWATSPRDVYFAIEGGVQHWDAVRRVSSRALELERGVQVSTLAARQDVGLLAAGGFAGEMVVKNLHTGAQGRPWAARQGGVHSSRLSADDDAITNAIHIAPIGPGGAATALLASNNDGLVRSFDADSMKEASKWRLPWAVNFSCLSPCARTALCVGDDTDALLVDARSGGVAARLEGHLDYNFAAAWHPDGTQFVTGSQDRTCRVWDLRQLQRARRVLAGRLGAVRSLRYSDDGAFLAMAEAADFVSLLDVGADYGRAQALDFFGEVAGVSFSPNDAQSFFVGVADLTYGSLLEFQRADPQQRFISL